MDLKIFNCLINIVSATPWRNCHSYILLGDITFRISMIVILIVTFCLTKPMCCFSYILCSFWKIVLGNIFII